MTPWAREACIAETFLVVPGGGLMAENVLYYGDNLPVLREHVRDESVDLVYLDPPFNSNQDYNVLFAERDGSRAAAQIKAFGDTWRWDQGSAAAFHDVVEHGPQPVSRAMQAFRTLVGESDVLAYLSMMAPRLVELHRVLKPTGSIYLHCDPTASHYLKMLMDAVFGPKHFLNEILWQRANAHNFKTRFWPRQHDSLLLYSKGEAFTLNPVYQPYGPEQLKRYRMDENGRLYTGQDLTVSAVRRLRQFEWRGVKPPAHRSWGASMEQLEQWYREERILLKKDGTPRFDGLKVYLDEMPGKQVGSVWTDVPRISNTAAERLGYPTQKPEALLDRILNASSNPGDLVLDPFCGCGTAVASAQRLGRHWCGIDVTHLAINLIKNRLLDSFRERVSFEVHGEPVSLPDAQALWSYDPFEFQAWALGLVGARVASSSKRGADRGVDGRLYFHDGGADTRQIIFSVKGGTVRSEHVRDLRGVIERERAEIGVLLTLEPPTTAMVKEAASAGFYDSPWGAHPRIQVLTIEELLAGARIDYPPARQVNLTFKKAPRAEVPAAQALEFSFAGA